MANSLPRLRSILERTVRWAWTRDETDRSVTRETVVNTIAMYAVTFLGMIVLGFVVARAGYTTAGVMVWIFGTAYSAFIGSMEIAWELLEYLDESEGESAATEQQARELSPGVTISNDVKFGFIVTVIALVTLLTTIQVAIRLSVYL